MDEIYTRMSGDRKVNHMVGFCYFKYALYVNAVFLTSIGLVLTSFNHTEVMASSFPFSHSSSFPPAGGTYIFGPIASVQLDNDGNPSWIIYGQWKSNLPTISNVTSNQTESIIPIFDASLRMVMVNGSGLHTHTITNFNLTKMSITDNNTKEFNGTVSASMREGPLSGVPISIKFLGNEVISIWLDPTRIKAHYGTTPIFGAIHSPFDRPMPMDGRGNFAR
jgi:hypothetical protein